MSDSDAALWEAVGGDPDELVVNGRDAEPDQEYVLREQFEALERRVTRLEQQVTGPKVRDSMSTLQKYAIMVEDGVDDSLSASDHRAVEIYRNWSDLAVRLANGSYGVSTRRKSNRKNGPSQLKVDLQNLLGEDLENVQIYRAMKRTAELSGGSAEPDQYGRMHVVGGIFEFHERTTPDNTDHTTYKVLIET